MVILVSRLFIGIFIASGIVVISFSVGNPLGLNYSTFSGCYFLSVAVAKYPFYSLFLSFSFRLNLLGAKIGFYTVY
jgi:hypothetical protein